MTSTSRRPGARALALALVTTCWAAATPAGSQPASDTAPPRRNALQADAPVPPAVYRSSLAQHRRHAEQPVQPWAQSNETVNRIGGWRAYAREAAQAQRAASASAPGAAGHGTHGRP